MAAFTITSFCQSFFKTEKEAMEFALKMWRDLPKDCEGNSLHEINYWAEGSGSSLEDRERIYYVSTEGLTKVYFYHYWCESTNTHYQEYIA